MNLAKRGQHALSRSIGWLCRRQRPFPVTTLIRWFIRTYHVNMEEAALSDPKAYASFNTFFTRALKPGARTVDTDPHAWVAPCDSAWIQAAPCDGHTIFAKGAPFDCAALLAYHARAHAFTQGAFANFYLAPKDYHRVHMPCDAQLEAMSYIPGNLHSVDPSHMPTERSIYSENERVIAYFQTQQGPLAMVLVGALNVGSIETRWHGVIKPSKQPQHWDYPTGAHCFKKGEEMGRFNMGSTVILCLGTLPKAWQKPHKARCIQLGQRILHID